MYTKEGGKNLLSFLKNPITFPLRLVLFCVVEQMSIRRDSVNEDWVFVFFVLRVGSHKRQKHLTVLVVHKILSHGKYLINQKQIASIQSHRAPIGNT